MGIQINGQTDRISAVDGTMTFPGTVTYEDVSRINVVGVVTAASFNSTTGNVVITENANVMFQNSARDTNRGAIQFTDGGDFRLRSGGALSESLRITSSGNMGIGTDNPARKLQLHENSSNGCFLSITNDTTGSSSGDGALIGLQNDESLLISQKETNSIFFHTSNTDCAYFSSGGTFALVGGGTVGSPAVSLNGSAPSNSMVLNTSGDLGLGTNNPYNNSGYTSLTLDDTTGSQIRLRTNGNERGLIYNTDSEFAVYAQNNIPINLWNQGRVQATLDYEGQFMLNSQDATSFALWRKQSPLILAQYGDYSRPVIALAYHRSSGFVNASGFFGDVIVFRGSTGAGHIPGFMRVCVSSAYTTNMRTGLGLGTGAFRFVTFTYNGSDYQGIQYNTDASANILLDGWYATRGFKPFSVAASSVTSLTVQNATTDARLTSSSSSNL